MDTLPVVTRRQSTNGVFSLADENCAQLAYYPLTRAPLRFDAIRQIEIESFAHFQPALYLRQKVGLFLPIPDFRQLQQTCLRRLNSVENWSLGLYNATK